MRQSNLKKHLQRKRRSARSASGSSVDRSGWQTRLAHKYLYISVTVRNVVMKNKSEMLVRCFNWFLRPIWRSWILLAIHFDCSSIYREYRNNFDQKLQNEGEKLKHLSVHPTSQTSFFGSRVMFVESFSVRVFTVKTLLPPPPPPAPAEIYFWIPVPLWQSQNELFFSSFDGSNWFQLRASIDRPLNPSWICRKTCLFFQLGKRNQGHSYQYARAYLKKSCIKKKDI